MTSRAHAMQCKREIRDLERRVHPLPSVKVQDGVAHLREGQLASSHDCKADSLQVMIPLHSAWYLRANRHSASPTLGARWSGQSRRSLKLRCAVSQSEKSSADQL